MLDDPAKVALSTSYVHLSGSNPAKWPHTHSTDVTRQASRLLSPSTHSSSRPAPASLESSNSPTRVSRSSGTRRETKRAMAPGTGVTTTSSSSSSRLRGARLAAAALAVVVCADSARRAGAAAATSATGSCPPKQREAGGVDQWNEWTTRGCDANCAAAGFADSACLVCAYADATSLAGTQRLRATSACYSGERTHATATATARGTALPCFENGECLVEFMSVAGADASSNSNEWAFRLGDPATASRFHQTEQVHVGQIDVPSSVSRL